MTWYPADKNGRVVNLAAYLARSRLYYEAHVTIPPLDNRQLEEVDALCEKYDFRRSTFEMHKDGLLPNAFVSARDESRDAIVGRVADMVAELVRRGYTVLRWKIEDTMLDSARGDSLLPERQGEAPVPREEGTTQELRR